MKRTIIVTDGSIRRPPRSTWLPSAAVRRELLRVHETQPPRDDA